jgi:AcrR family transcriptional regulator
MNDLGEGVGRDGRRVATAGHVQEVALELIARDGYAHVSVDAIAVAAGVSPRTFHRYFPSKQDVLLKRWEEMDQRVIDELNLLSFVEAPVREICDIYIALTVGTPDLASFRVWRKAIGTAPDVQARGSGESRRRLSRAMRRVFAEWLGVDADLDVRPDAMSAAVLGVNGVAVEKYVDSNGQEDLVALFVVAFDFLARGLGSVAREDVGRRSGAAAARGAGPARPT